MTATLADSLFKHPQSFLFLASGGPCLKARFGIVSGSGLKLGNRLTLEVDRGALVAGACIL